MSATASHLSTANANIHEHIHMKLTEFGIENAFEDAENMTRKMCLYSSI